MIDGQENDDVTNLHGNIEEASNILYGWNNNPPEGNILWKVAAVLLDGCG